VNLGFVDFSTPELRQHLCAEEVPLNQRGSPGIYKGAVAVSSAVSAACDPAVRFRVSASTPANELFGSRSDGVLKVAIRP
jgi:hypothetical protein